MEYINLKKYGKDEKVNTDQAVNGKEAKKAVFEELRYAGIIDIDSLELPYYLESVGIIITVL